MNEQLKNILTEIQNDSLIKLADNAPTLQDYLRKYFAYTLEMEDCQTLFNALEERRMVKDVLPAIPSPLKIIKKKVIKAKTQKLATV